MGTTSAYSSMEWSCAHGSCQAFASILKGHKSLPMKVVKAGICESVVTSPLSFSTSPLIHIFEPVSVVSLSLFISDNDVLDLKARQTYHLSEESLAGHIEPPGIMSTGAG